MSKGLQEVSPSSKAIDQRFAPANNGKVLLHLLSSKLSGQIYSFQRPIHKYVDQFLS
jgi:hypothetical protein